MARLRFASRAPVCATVVLPVEDFSANGQQCLNRLCQPRGQAHREPKCLYYGFSFNGNEVHCREGYEGAEAALSHLANVGSLLEGALKISELSRLEVHGMEEELAKLRGPLADFHPTYFTLEYGIRR